MPGTFTNSAERIGLFCTEMLLVDRNSAPGEWEQLEACQQVLLAADNKSAIFRTMDIGDDKNIRYLSIP